jgi:hypothetical protein
VRLRNVVRALGEQPVGTGNDILMASDHTDTVASLVLQNNDHRDIIMFASDDMTGRGML